MYIQAGSTITTLSLSNKQNIKVRYTVYAVDQVLSSFTTNMSKLNKQTKQTKKQKGLQNIQA